MKKKKMLPSKLPPKAERDWRTEEEAAAYLGTSAFTLRKMRAAMCGPEFYRPTRKRMVRYLDRALDKWRDENRFPAV